MTIENEDAAVPAEDLDEPNETIDGDTTDAQGIQGTAAEESDEDDDEAEVDESDDEITVEPVANEESESDA